jgi:hypothetical protein
MHVRKSLALAGVMVAAALVWGCGRGPGVAVAAAASSRQASGAHSVGLDHPCDLLTDTEVSDLAPGLQPHRLDTVAGVDKICDWPNAHGIPVVQVQVYDADPQGPAAELQSSLGPSGYQIIQVAGVGERAAAAVQPANPDLGLKEDVASLVAQSEGRAVSISTPGVQIVPDTPKFQKLKELAITAISRATGQNAPIVP